jgi:hypothetical protein
MLHEVQLGNNPYLTLCIYFISYIRYPGISHLAVYSSFEVIIGN